jgi:hypothetical protein
MAASESETPVGEVPGEEQQAPPAQIVVKTGEEQAIKEPLLEKEFLPMLVDFQLGTGIKDPVKAAKMLALGLDKIGVSPYKHYEEAKRMAQQWAGIREFMQGGALTEGAWDAAGAVVAKEAAKRVIGGPREPSMVEEMRAIMKMMMPYRIAMDMFSGRSMHGDDDDSPAMREVKKMSDRLESMEARQREDERDRKLEERFGKIESMIEGKSKSESSDVVKKLEEIKEGLKPKEPELAKKFEELRKELVEKERLKEMDDVKSTVANMERTIEERISRLQESMNRGEPQKSVAEQAATLFSSVGDLYRNAGDMAKVMGYEPKDEKISGNVRKDLFSLGRKALDVVDKAMKYPRAHAPPKEEVKHMPLPASAVIPIGQTPPGEKPPAQEEPAKSEPVKLDGQDAAPIVPVLAESETASPTVAPFAKKPKPPETPAKTPATTPAEQPAEKSKEG